MPTISISASTCSLVTAPESPLWILSDSPIWRPTYRLVMAPAADSGALQGWALVHNDTDETWRRVQVELVNGRPDSFLYPLAAPRYSDIMIAR